jgi:hypothetical protein
MDKEDIIRMAREAGLLVVGTADGGEAVYTWPKGITDELERFAALVAAAEREACAKVCEERQEVFQKYYTKGLAAMCAEAIRARSEL